MLRQKVRLDANHKGGISENPMNWFCLDDVTHVEQTGWWGCLALDDRHRWSWWRNTITIRWSKLSAIIHGSGNSYPKRKEFRSSGICWQDPFYMFISMYWEEGYLEPDVFTYFFVFVAPWSLMLDQDLVVLSPPAWQSGEGSTNGNACLCMGWSFWDQQWHLRTWWIFEIEKKRCHHSQHDLVSRHGFLTKSFKKQLWRLALIFPKSCQPLQKKLEEPPLSPLCIHQFGGISMAPSFQTRETVEESWA